MKNHIICGVLLATVSSISLSSNSFTLKAKDTRPINEPPRAATQAILPSMQTILWLCLLASFHYINEKRHRIAGWQLEDFALLKIIKDNATGLWHLYQERYKTKIIPLVGT